MKKIGLLLFVAGLASCSNPTAEQQLDALKKKADTLVKKVETSEVTDSLKSKGEKIWDSTKSKGGRLVVKGKKEMKDLKNKFWSK